MIQNPIITGKKLPTLTSPGTAADLLAGKQLIDGDGNIVDGTMAAAKTPVFEDVSATYELSGNYYVYTITVSQEIDTFLGLGADTANYWSFGFPYATAQLSAEYILGHNAGQSFTFCQFTISGNTISFKSASSIGDPGAINAGKICYLPK